MHIHTESKMTPQQKLIKDPWMGGRGEAMGVRGAEGWGRGGPVRGENAVSGVTSVRMEDVSWGIVTGAGMMGSAGGGGAGCSEPLAWDQARV